MATHLSGANRPQPPTPATEYGTSADSLVVVVSFGPDGARIQLRGELDVSSVALLHARIDQVCSVDCVAVVFDVSELTFCDSTGLGALLQAAARCAQDGTDMHVTGARSAVRRVIEITHTKDALHLIDES